MSQYSEYYDAIDEIKGFLSRDLIGPVTEEEVIENIEPLSYYAMGILWAKRLGRGTMDEDMGPDIGSMDDGEEIEDPVHADNDSIMEANKFKPSAMGVSVMIPEGTEFLEVEFACGKYIMSSVESPPTEEGKMPRTRKYYARKPYKFAAKFAVPTHCGTIRCKEHERFRDMGADITLCVRKVMNDGSKLVTVSVSNALEAPQRGKEQNESAMFQCRLHLFLPDGFVPVYQNALSGLGQSEEEQINAMQYRDVLNYAYGHGCSVEYAESEKITDIYSDFMPSERVLQMMPGGIADGEPLKPAYWRSAGRGEACEKLLSFIGEYSVWREKQEALASGLAGCTASAKIVIGQIDVCIARLKRGVEILRSNDDAWFAFKLMNEAMLLQRAKTKKLKDDQLENVTWYPFQLAYILQIIPDMVDENSHFRGTVDLLWFPTGGGKTEAYLGVAAFVIFYRRLSTKPLDDGVTLIMRYTLRLLTIQQFERASALICACEHLRKNNNISGGEMSIGLWIGSGMTPNRIEGLGGAAEILKELRDNPDKKVYEGNPVQITACPWCGAPIDLDGYEIGKHNALVIRCNNNPRCEFHHSLPIYVVDEDIYRVRPTLVLSTIDKFARLAWEIESKSLFGGGRCLPPELIIQDELHLISGPLGSLAGIYEIGVEYLCNRSGRYPKVIASTATVKNAAEQIRNLYNKQMSQFPPGGINFSDSFFAVRASEDDRPARTYIGLCETGGTIVDLMIRVYANLIFVKLLFIKQGKPERVIDQFSTVIGYFNAIKDLGGADNIISDRIHSHIRTLAGLKFKADSDKAGLTHSDIRTGIHDELTSRKTSKEIKETLGRLELDYRDPAYLSYMLASNMFSVGIDIDRLGVLTMYNQPKSNAEYIQATSRVGRRNPGIVLSMYNGSRSRDKSHYEQFGFYHKAFYRYVETTSVTPFSARAIEKAVHCVFIIMLRLSEPSLGANDSAVNFRSDAECVKKAREFILNRIRMIHPEGVRDAEDWLTDISERWQELAEENPDTLVYKSNQSGYCSLLISGERGSNLDFPATLNSLRNVEASSNLFIQERD
ncbi:MAG: hypothetical protein LBO21_00020 [Synergistaceae bacterium]|jgi:hypothetical protein|nr:hypothetical protein [Synergistaceae bacterium]